MVVIRGSALNASLRERIRLQSNVQNVDAVLLTSILRQHFDFLGPQLDITVEPRHGPLDEIVVTLRLPAGSGEGAVQAESLHAVGIEYALDRRYGLAVATFKRAAELVPLSAQYRRSIAQAQIELANYSDAEAELLRALTVEPDNADAQMMLGRVYHSTGRMELAEQLYRQSIALHATPWALTNLGAVHGARGELHEAADCFERALKLDVHYAQASHGLSLVREKLRLRHSAS
jgi:tetratricopeptide (TPR) repeat protein